MLHVFIPFLITIFSYFVIFLFFFLITSVTYVHNDIHKCYSTFFNNCIEEEDDVKFMFQINGFNLKHQICKKHQMSK